MSWFKDFKLDWFGKKKYDNLAREIQELKKLVTEEKTGKPYKKAYYSNGIITIVLHSGDVLSKVCDIQMAKKLDSFSTEFEIIEFYSDKPAIAIPVETELDEKEKMAKEIFASNAAEVLDILGDDFDENNGEFFYKGVNIAIPTILLNAMVETKRQGMDNQFNSFKNFWLWASLNPVESSRNDLFSFIRKNDVKLTGTGLLVLYRRIVATQQKKGNKTLEDFVSQQYFGVKKSHKSPKSYTILEETNGNYKRVNVGKEDLFPTLRVVGNLHEIYQRLHEVVDNVYTDAHTHSKKIQIGTIYKEDESKIDLSNKRDCSNGLHVASKSFNYGSFGDIPVLCLVNPSKVRAVPVYSTGKMRVSEMFIASTLKVDKNGKYMDEDLDLVPYDEEYCNISANELEQASKQGLHVLDAKDNKFTLSKRAVRNILDEIKSQVQGRVTVLD